MNKVIRSKPFVKVKLSPPQKKEVLDLDFGYMEDLNRKKMFGLIRIGQIKPEHKKFIHTYDKIPNYPKQKSLTPEIRIKTFYIYTPREEKQVLHEQNINDPYQMEATVHKPLGRKLSRTQRINKRLLDKYTI
ncbi:hypothetical protein pb186bvf_008079 [Paramecium bursaria]